LPEIEAKYPGALEKQFIPTDTALWKMDRYEDSIDPQLIKERKHAQKKGELRR